MVRCITCNVFQMRRLCRFFNCLAWFVKVEFNRMPWPNNKMYDDPIFADRFRYQLTMFGIAMLIGLSRLLLTHIAYEIDTAKIIPAFFRISYCLHDLTRLNSIVCHVQTTKCTMMRFSLIDSAINWLCLEYLYWYIYLDSFMLILHMKQILTKSLQHSAEFPIVCMIWYGWIQSSAMWKEQGVWLCGFRWWIQISIELCLMCVYW